MKVRLSVRDALTLIAGLVLIGVGPLGGQPPRVQTNPNAPRTMVQVFGSTDKVVGPEASDDLRDRLIRAYPARLLWVIDKKDILSMLEQSGYPVDEQLPPSDEAQLAKAQRADDYIRGRVTRAGELLRVEASLVLTRDPSLTQPLPVAEGPRADKAVAPLVKAIQDARKQLPHEKACINAARDNKLDEALKAADAGIAEYPQATLVRYCKMQVLVRQGAAPADQVAMAKEILAIDSTSRVALAVAADAAQKAGNADEANGYLLRLLAANPDDAALASRVIDALAASGKLALAKDVVIRAVEVNPGDPDLIELQFKILSAAGDLKGAIATGEELIQIDSIRATAAFYTRLVALYASDGQAAKASAAAGRATTRYPQDAELWQLYAQTLKKAGEVQPSIVAARRALEINPQLPNGWTQIAVAYNDLNELDNALTALRSARTAGDDRNQLGAFALSIGNKLYRAAVAEDPKQVPSFRAPFPFLFFADSTSTDAQVKGNASFLIGVSSYYIAQILATGLQASKSCEEAKAAQAAAVDAMTYTRQGGRTSPDAAAQILGAVNQLSPYIDRQVTTLCR